MRRASLPRLLQPLRDDSKDRVESRAVRFASSGMTSKHAIAPASEGGRNPVLQGCNLISNGAMRFELALFGKQRPNRDHLDRRKDRVDSGLTEIPGEGVPSRGAS